ncbi:MAG: argininosuccinate synthase, partial [Endomicrobiia bacterium]|nr:argininosuccinate synthase [Endomicrobiia bacterium]
MKIVIAYSGGLDTSVMITWLIEHYRAEVIAVIVDVGQNENLAAIKKKAVKTGASKVYVIAAKKEFAENYVIPALKANAVYEHKYLLATSLSRPLIAQKIVEVARRENADAVAHGATGKGNDQVRFELTFKALAPDIKIIAPWREWEMKSREDEIAYARKRKIPIEVTPAKPYSSDANLWHISYEGGILEDPAREPDEKMFRMTVSPELAPPEARYVEIEFEKGAPVSLDGKRMPAVELINRLNKIAGANGVGRVDIVENRLVGIKSRGVYECPAATVLLAAHRELESLVLDRDTSHYKELLSQKYAELVYNGLWFTPLKESIDAFITETQKSATGSVRLKLYKGSVIIAGRKSPRSLYWEELATFGEE